MSIGTTINYDSLPEFIRAAVNKEVRAFAEKEFESAKEEVMRKIDKYKDEVVAGVVLHVERNMRLETYGQDLRITIVNKDYKVVE